MIKKEEILIGTKDDFIEYFDEYFKEQSERTGYNSPSVFFGTEGIINQIEGFSNGFGMVFYFNIIQEGEHEINCQVISSNVRLKPDVNFEQAEAMFLEGINKDLEKDGKEAGIVYDGNKTIIARKDILKKEYSEEDIF